jgi:hypothetical protein
VEAKAPYLEANRVYDRVIAGAPDSPIAYHHYANHLIDWWRLYDRLNRPADRAENFRKLIALRVELVRLQPSSGARKTQLAWAHYHLARQLTDLGDLATARAEVAAVRRMLADEIPPDQTANMRRLAETLAPLTPRLDPEPASAKP